MFKKHTVITCLLLLFNAHKTNAGFVHEHSKQLCAHTQNTKVSLDALINSLQIFDQTYPKIQENPCHQGANCLKKQMIDLALTTAGLDPIFDHKTPKSLEPNTTNKMYKALSVFFSKGANPSLEHFSNKKMDLFSFFEAHLKLTNYLKRLKEKNYYDLKPIINFHNDFLTKFGADISIIHIPSVNGSLKKIHTDLIDHIYKKHTEEIDYINQNLSNDPVYSEAEIKRMRFISKIDFTGMDEYNLDLKQLADIRSLIDNMYKGINKASMLNICQDIQTITFNMYDRQQEFSYDDDDDETTKNKLQLFGFFDFAHNLRDYDLKSLFNSYEAIKKLPLGAKKQDIDNIYTDLKAYISKNNIEYFQEKLKTQAESFNSDLFYSAAKILDVNSKLPNIITSQDIPIHTQKFMQAADRAKTLYAAQYHSVIDQAYSTIIDQKTVFIQKMESKREAVKADLQALSNLSSAYPVATTGYFSDKNYKPFINQLIKIFSYISELYSDAGDVDQNSEELLTNEPAVKYAYDYLKTYFIQDTEESDWLFTYYTYLSTWLTNKTWEQEA
jgi:hypothetical protein